MNRINVKFDIKKVCRNLLEESLDASGLDYSLSDSGEVIFKYTLSSEQVAILESRFDAVGITIIEKRENSLVQKIRDAIQDIVEGEELGKNNLSTLLTERLNYSYTHLSKVFSNSAYTSIESYLILKKIEKVKSYLLNDGLTLTEIAHKLDYSSVSHLSSQFKNKTGLTPSMFRKLIEKRKKTKELY